MDFPAHIELLLDRFRVKPETKAALYELYSSVGNAILEEFALLAERSSSVAAIEPEEVRSLKSVVVSNFVRRHHGSWMSSVATPSLWHPRAAEGRASGLLLPMGDVAAGTGDNPGAHLYRHLEKNLAADQPVPEGVLIFGKNAHYGGRLETVSFDIVPFDLDTALACAAAAGQQHTVPGSIGETSGTVDAAQRALLLWETQPNVLKPSGERNRELLRLWRKHRNWHIATLSAAITWGFRQELRVFVLRGVALAIAHEVNAAKPVSEQIARFHDRTVVSVVDCLGAELSQITPEDEAILARSELMNHSLSRHVAEQGAGAVMWRVRLTS